MRRRRQDRNPCRSGMATSSSTETFSRSPPDFGCALRVFAIIAIGLVERRYETRSLSVGVDEGLQREGAGDRRRSAKHRWNSRTAHARTSPGGRPCRTAGFAVDLVLGLRTAAVASRCLAHLVWNPAFRSGRARICSSAMLRMVACCDTFSVGTAMRSLALVNR